MWPRLLKPSAGVVGIDKILQGWGELVNLQWEQARLVKLTAYVGRIVQTSCRRRWDCSRLSAGPGKEKT